MVTALALLPNGSRLSCGAQVGSSQMEFLPRQTGAASSKRMLDGALGTEARTRRARLGGRAALG